MKTVFLAALIIPITLSSAGAFEGTISKASSIKAHPVANVAMGELAPIPGVAVAGPREAAVYQPEIGGRSPTGASIGKTPVPSPRPLIALACPIVWQD